MPNERSHREATVASRLLGKPVRKSTVYWTLQGTGWAVFGAAMFYWGLSHLTAFEAAANKVILVLTGFALTHAAGWAYRTAREREVPVVAHALLVATVSAGGAILWIELHNGLYAVWLDAMRGQPVSLVWTDLHTGTVLFFVFVLLAWALLYLGINAWDELETERDRAVRAEALAHEARLRALQSQLEPHFLFNTLNAISTLVAEGRNAAATRMISRLSEFLRMTLEANDRPEISVAEELDFIRGYVEIEHVRFGDRLRVSIEAADEALTGLVPALVLQPLVENAVKHGVLRHERGGSVLIAVAKTNGMLRLTVVDDGPGAQTGTCGRKGIGLANTEARLAELYGADARLMTVSPGLGGFESTIELPFRRAIRQTAGISTTSEVGA